MNTFHTPTLERAKALQTLIDARDDFGLPLVQVLELENGWTQWKLATNLQPKIEEPA